MLRYHNYDIVCQEIPHEITLAINISNCPNRCPGCHSPWLQEDIGMELDRDVLSTIIAPYQNGITCVCFMGGDRYPQEVIALAKFCKQRFPHLRMAWYSGKSDFPTQPMFDYVKLGSYVESLGGLRSPTTNQRLYKINPDSSLHPILFHQ